MTGGNTGRLVCVAVEHRQCGVTGGVGGNTGRMYDRWKHRQTGLSQRNAGSLMCVTGGVGGITDRLVCMTCGNTGRLVRSISHWNTGSVVCVTGGVGGNTGRMYDRCVVCVTGVGGR